MRFPSPLANSTIYRQKIKEMTKRGYELTHSSTGGWLKGRSVQLILTLKVPTQPRIPQFTVKEFSPPYTSRQRAEDAAFAALCRFVELFTHHDSRPIKYARGKRSFLEKLEHQAKCALSQYEKEKQGSAPLVAFAKALTEESCLNTTKQFVKFVGNQATLYKTDLTPTIEETDLGFYCSTIGDRPEQEDTHVFAHITIAGEQCPFYAVYDGHGGDEASKLLEAQFHKRVEEQLQTLTTFDEETFIDHVVAVFEAFNQEIHLDKNAEQAGATAICAIKYKDQLYTFNAGDGCGLLLNRETGAIVPLNELAKPSDPRFSSGIEKLGGIIGEGRVRGDGCSSGVARCFGGKKFQGLRSRPKVVKQPVNENSVLFLSCDGPLEYITRKTIGLKAIQLLQKGGSLRDVSMELLERAYKSGSGDNISILMANLVTSKPQAVPAGRANKGKEEAVSEVR